MPARPEQFRLSVVVPFYEEGHENVERFFAAVTPVLAGLTPDYEFVGVDDGSQDDTPQALRDARLRDPRIKVIVLSRNYGHQLALTAGLAHATGDAVVVMDGDLQDPPQVIEEMVKRWRDDGLDVIYGQRRRRPGDSLVKRTIARVFYRLLQGMSEQEIPMDVGDFRLMDRQVVEALNTFPERNRFLRGLVSWMGFRQGAVLFDRPARAGGEPKYTLRKLGKLAADGIFSFSRQPLRLATWLGLGCSAFAFGYLVWILIRGFFMRDDGLSGWYALISVVLFLGGIQLVCLGLIGEYIGRIYEEVKARPLYLVREKLGLEVADPLERPAPAPLEVREPPEDPATPT
jgi:polyisoprenyl-phosphate glycosyltransferase